MTIKRTLEELWQEILDEETTEQILDQFRFSSTGTHLSEEQNAVALALLQETQRRIAGTTNPDGQLTIAREARTAWHKGLRLAGESSIMQRLEPHVE